MMNKVKLKNLANGQMMEYTLVSETEADLKTGKLSIQTPIAKALIGRKAGEKVEVSVPSGTLSLEIVEISI
jgi:transcription elongation factor GreA